MGSLIISDVSERLELVRSCCSFSQGPRRQRRERRDRERTSATHTYVTARRSLGLLTSAISLVPGAKDRRNDLARGGVVSGSYLHHGG